MGDLALTNMALGDNAAALTLAERAVAMFPSEKDALIGPKPLDVLARVAAHIPLFEPLRKDPRFQKLANAQR
jgi:hypothetical protein